jgi:hypothetical protein
MMNGLCCLGIKSGISGRVIKSTKLVLCFECSTSAYTHTHTHPLPINIYACNHRSSAQCIPDQECKGKVNVLEPIGEQAQTPHKHVDIGLPFVRARRKVLGDVRSGRGMEATDQSVEHSPLQALALWTGEAVLFVDCHPNARGIEATVASVALWIGFEVDVAFCSRAAKINVQHGQRKYQVHATQWRVGLQCGEPSSSASSHCELPSDRCRVSSGFAHATESSATN